NGMIRRIPLILFGTGQVGRALAYMVMATREQQERLGVRLEFVALVDREGALVEERGLSDPVLESALRLKARGQGLATHERGYYQNDPVAIVDVAGQADTVVVDTTAADADVITPALLTANRLGYGVVLANKKPLTASAADFDRLVRTPPGCGYEATVGAGLPVIRTLKMLLETGDEIVAIR